MRFSYTEPVIASYSVIHTIQNDIYVNEAPTTTLTEHHTWEVRIAYQWNMTCDKKNCNGLWETTTYPCGDVKTHYFNDIEPTPFNIEKELAVEDIAEIKKNFVDKPYDCKKCIHSVNFKRGYCTCLSMERRKIRESKDFHMQTCTDYWPKREYIKDGLERKV